MGTERLAAFSDGVLAILITVLVLQLPRPSGPGWSGLTGVWPTLLAYVLSFVIVGIYWNNHHHLLALARVIDGRVMWANLALLFALSLLPFVTGWVGDSLFAPVPMGCYAGVTLSAGAAFTGLGHVLRRADPDNEALAHARGGGVKERASMGGYALALLLSCAGRWGALAAAVLVTLVALMWVLPDARVERTVRERSTTAAG